MKDESLEETAVGIFDKLGCSIDTDRIEVCHQVIKNNNTINVKFTRHKDCQKVSNKKEKLRTTKWRTLVYMGREKYLSTVAYALIIRCYGRKVRNYLL